MFTTPVANAVRSYLAGALAFNALSNVVHDALAEVVDDLTSDEARSTLGLVHLIADVDSALTSQAELRDRLAAMFARTNTSEVLLGSRPPARTGTTITAQLSATM
jgi:hypothetical protein